MFLFFGTKKSVNAQIYENFNSSSSNTLSTWLGDTAKFMLVNGKLQSKSTLLNDKFYISTPSKYSKNTQWEFYINLQFKTSSTNYVDVFLYSDSARLVGQNSGYFIRIGGVDDEISFFLKQGPTSKKLIDGTNGISDFNNNIFKVKVVCDTNRFFSLWYDTTGTGNRYIDGGSVFNNEFSAANFSGFLIKQSSLGFFNKHFFDDLYVGPIVKDNLKPIVKAVEVKAKDTLRIIFSELLAKTSLDLKNFEINYSIGNPAIINVNSKDSSSLEIVLPNGLKEKIIYDLDIKNIQDKAGNIMKDTVIKIEWLEIVNPGLYELIITELMPDPEPTNKLPNAEYIEIYNASEKNLKLTNCTLMDNSSGGKFPECILQADSFLIVCAFGNESLFKQYGKVIGLKGFPSLNNSAEEIFLRNTNGKLIHRVLYDIESYGNALKAKGGWSIEMIDTKAPCTLLNLIASISTSGGTPGKTNSVNGNKNSSLSPFIKNVLIKNNNTFVIVFNQSIDSESAIKISNYHLKSNSINRILVNFETVEIFLSESLVEGETLEIALTNISDCSMKFLKDTTIQITLPGEPLPDDLIINEILFNPASGGNDFVEVYNKSQRVLSLKNLVFFNLNTNKEPDNYTVIDTSGMIIKPGGLLVFTSNPMWVIQNYKYSNSKAIIGLTSIPALDDREGHIGIMNLNGIVIDEIDYTEKMHFPLLTKFEGVSLERISYRVPSTEKTNFTSASASYGYATPGMVNSHSISEHTQTNWLNIVPDLFSPDEDGNADIVEISIVSENTEQQATILIFDANGKFIATIANNMPIGNKQSWFWNGMSDSNKRSEIGIYIVYAELFGLDNMKKINKKTLTLGGK